MSSDGAGKPTEAEHDYDDIPGTFVFDAERSRQGYRLNMFCMSLMKAENRKAFKADEAEYLEKFKLTPEQTEAILKRDYNRMLELGGNIYFTAKLGATDGHPFRHLAAVMTGSTQEDYAEDDARGRPLGGRQPQQVRPRHCRHAGGLMRNPRPRRRPGPIRNRAQNRRRNRPRVPRRNQHRVRQKRQCCPQQIEAKRRG